MISRIRMMQNLKSLKSRSSETTPPERAYQYSLRLLAARDYSSAKMRGKLALRDFSEEDIETVIRRLEGEGWMDDRRYAERFAEAALSAGRFYGPRLRQELRRRGFPSELVNDILNRVRAGHDELDELRSVIGRRYPDFIFAASSDREKRRVVGWLQRRGFGISAIFRVLRESV